MKGSAPRLVLKERHKQLGNSLLSWSPVLSIRNVLNGIFVALNPRADLGRGWGGGGGGGGWPG